jgi:hypothetical protein
MLYRGIHIQKNSDGKLSGGAIAGIVIASIALLAGITILAICLRKKKCCISFKCD